MKNLVNEDEARTKWCPMGQVAVGELSFERDNRKIMCIGSRCMAWRDLVKDKIEGTSNNSFITREIIGGYCGLAGKPISK